MKGILNPRLASFATTLGTTLLFSVNSHSDNPRNGGELMLGGGYVHSDEPFDEGISGFRIYMDGRYQWHGLFVESGNIINRQKDKPAVGFNFYNTDHWNFDLLGTIADDSIDYRYRAGNYIVYRSRSSIAGAGFRAIGTFNNTTIQAMGLPIASEGSRDDGVLRHASLWLDQKWQINDKWEFKVSLGAQYRSAELLDHKYGVEPIQADNYIQPYEASDGTDYTAHFELNYAITDHLFIQPYFNITKFSDSAMDSPLVKTAINSFDRSEQERKLGINLNYRF
ncbi:hypothetical protein TDB9533_03689 [Thalassocella blandensis]|nr:hypothetical protein TDB9533_03689 [Thalassocella blandensis]